MCFTPFNFGLLMKSTNHSNFLNFYYKFNYDYAHIINAITWIDAIKIISRNGALCQWMTMATRWRSANDLRNSTQNDRICCLASCTLQLPLCTEHTNIFYLHEMWAAGWFRGCWRFSWIKKKWKENIGDPL